MFGKSAFRDAPALFFSLLSLLIFGLVAMPAVSHAQASAKAAANAPTQIGKVIENGASVYEEPDFDSKVIGHLKVGTRWRISNEIFGAFYRVNLPNGRSGYVTDADIVPEKAVKGTKAAKSAPPAGEVVKEGARLDIPPNVGPGQRRTFDQQYYQGLSIASVRYREKTMALEPTDNMLLLGFKASGQDLLVDGLNSSFNVQLSPGAPKYYEQATGRSADGFLLLMDGLVENATLHSPNTMSIFGFGPMFRFSKFGVTLPVSGGPDESYSLEDMAIGAKFSYGLAQRFGDFAARLEFQYYWEKSQYYGFSLTIQYGNSSR